LSIKTHGGIRSLASLLLIVFMCLFAVELYMKFTATSLWDDSYMFIRYADGFLSEGRLVFNPGGPQAYGLTSPAFLAVLIPIRMLLHDDPTLPLLLGSGIAGLLFAGLIALTVIRLTSGTGAAVARGAAVLTCFTAAYASSDLAVHFTSGMDTTLAMAFLAFFIILNTPGNRLNPGRTAILSGILGGAAFLGGTVAPIGGHNILEPLSQGLPVVVGPHHGNHGVIVADGVERGVVGVARTPEEMAGILVEWTGKPGLSLIACDLAAAGSLLFRRELSGLLEGLML